MEYKNNKLELRSRYYYNQLTLEDQYIYRKIYSTWIKGNSEVTLHIPGNDFITPGGKKISDIACFVIYENPHLFHVDTRLINYQRFGDDVKVWVKPLYSEKEYLEIKDKVFNMAKKIVEKVPESYSTIKKYRFIHNILAKNITYEYANGNERHDREIHTIVGPLLHRKCVCEGYARLFQLICEMCALPSIYLYGDTIDADKSECHAWNIIEYKGNNYHVDVTWDSLGNKNIKHEYFLRGDDYMRKSRKWDEKFYPVCKKDYR